MTFSNHSSILFDYESLLKDRVIIITGVGRSGTTILGKLIGSMEPAYYLFEPAIMKYDVHYPGLKSLIQAKLCEDYFIPLVQGRSLNLNPGDESYYGHYYSSQSIKTARAMFGSKSEAISYIQAARPYLVIKTNEIQPLLQNIRRIFPGCEIFHIIRNGLHVVASSIARGWHTGDYYNNTAVVEQMVQDPACNYPYYIGDESAYFWSSGWTQTTRAACVWRTLVRRIRIPYSLQYEKISDWCSDVEDLLPNLRATDLTIKHIKDIKGFKSRTVPVRLSAIQQPERDKFKKMMQEIGYL